MPGARPATAFRVHARHLRRRPPGPIDERLWQDKADLARAYVAWGAHAHGAEAHGEASEAMFRRRLSAIEAVIHNQDNREHDLLDSDDYYQSRAA
jgi:cobaltochelatase CobN